MNIQNIPKGLEVVRRAFVPRLGAFSFFDYKQIEPRLLAYYLSQIGDDRLAAYIRSGTDPYTAIVEGIYGPNPTDKQRQDGKVLFLSLMYGGGTKTVMAQFDVTKVKARSMIDGFHEAWPGVSELADILQSTVARRGYIKALDGRHLHLEEYGEHKLVNKLIQGGAAGVMKQGLLNVDKWLLRSELESKMVTVIHDEIILDGPESELDVLHECVPDLMCLQPKVNEVVPLLVDHEVSTTSWAQKEAYGA